MKTWISSLIILSILASSMGYAHEGRDRAMTKMHRQQKAMKMRHEKKHKMIHKKKEIIREKSLKHRLQ